jgi:hypothetical protein
MSGVNLVASLLTPDYSHVYLVETDIMKEAKRRDGIFEGVIGRLCVPDANEDGESRTFEATFRKDANETLTFRPADSDRDYVREALGQPGDPEGNYILDWASADMDVMPPQSLTVWFRMPESLREGIYRAVRSYSDELNVFIPSKSQPPRADKARRGTRRFAWLFYGGVLIGSLPLAIVGAMSHFQRGGSSTAQRAWTMAWLAVGILVGPSTYFQPTFAFLFGRNPTVGVGLKMAMVLYGVSSIGGMVVVADMMTSYGKCVRIY